MGRSRMTARKLFGNVGLIVPNGKDQLNYEKGYATYNKR